MKTHLKPKLEVKKLVVRRSMVRELNTQSLAQAVGGSLPDSSRCVCRGKF